MMPDVHARLSASGAHRWMNCPPSVALEDGFPDKSSQYAEEGTLAHGLAELIMRYNNKEITKTAYTRRLNKIKEDPLYSQEMMDYIVDYTHTVWEIANEVKAVCKDRRVLFEQRLDFSEYVPEGFGTGDVVIIADDLIHIIDLKYGKGVGVSAQDNPQLRLYGVGAYLEHSLLYDIRRVRMTIIQPRLENVSTEELTVEELLKWADTEVKEKASLAMAGEGEYQVGDHCRFCKAYAVCRAQKDYQMELARYDFAEAPTLKDDEVGDVLYRIDALVRWAESIKEYAYNEALNGKKYDGWKLVEGRSNRKYTDEPAIATTLESEGYAETDIYNKKLKGITDMEKLLGKKQFNDLLSSYVIKPEGKPVLVTINDTRPELNNVSAAQEDFKGE